MTRWLFVLLLVGACGGSTDDDDTDLSLDEPITEENFREKFAERFCTEFRQCKPGATCVEDFIQAGNDTGEDCEYSQSAADACMEAAWPCVSSAEDPLLDIPRECEIVWVCD